MIKNYLKSFYLVKNHILLILKMVYYLTLFSIIGENNSTKFVFDFQESGTIFGSSPEKLFSISNNQFKTEAIAGSFKSTSNLNLIDKDKEIDEHNFVTEYLKSKLSNFSKTIKIYENEILTLNQISHIKTKNRIYP